MCAAWHAGMDPRDVHAASVGEHVTPTSASLHHLHDVRGSNDHLHDHTPGLGDELPAELDEEVQREMERQLDLQHLETLSRAIQDETVRAAELHQQQLQRQRQQQQQQQQPQLQPPLQQQQLGDELHGERGHLHWQEPQQPLPQPPQQHQRSQPSLQPVIRTSQQLGHAAVQSARAHDLHPIAVVPTSGSVPASMAPASQFPHTAAAVVAPASSYAVASTPTATGIMTGAGATEAVTHGVPPPSHAPSQMAVHYGMVSHAGAGPLAVLSHITSQLQPAVGNSAGSGGAVDGGGGGSRRRFTPGEVDRLMAVFSMNP